MKNEPAKGERRQQNQRQRCLSYARTAVVGFCIVAVLTGSLFGYGIATGSVGPDRGGLAGVGAVAAQETATTSGENATSATTSESNASGAAVTFTNQTTATGTNVTITNATLPEGGFVAIHGNGYLAGVTDTTLITVSRYLEPGSYRNLTIPIEAGVPGGYGNQSKLNGTETLTARLYTDSDSDQQFDYLLSSDDSPYETESGSVTETTEVIVEGTRGSPSWTIPTAEVTFEDQSSGGKAVTVQRARLPDGGFLVIHDSRYLPPENDTFGSVIGVSEYLSPNESFDNTEVRLFSVPGRSLNRTQLQNDTTLVVRPSRDTNGNQKYDYLASNGTEDSGYTNNSEAVVERADITINASESQQGSNRELTETESGRPVNISAQPNQGIFKTISETFQGPLFDLIVGLAFVLFVAFFGYQIRS